MDYLYSKHRVMGFCPLHGFLGVLKLCIVLFREIPSTKNSIGFCKSRYRGFLCPIFKPTDH